MLADNENIYPVATLAFQALTYQASLILNQITGKYFFLNKRLVLLNVVLFRTGRSNYYNIMINKIRVSISATKVLNHSEGSQGLETQLKVRPESSKILK